MPTLDANACSAIFPKAQLGVVVFHVVTKFFRYIEGTTSND